MPYSNITITTDPNLSYEQYDFIQVAHDENNYIIGRVVSYNKTSGQLIFTPIKVEGSGSFSTWQISLTGDPGDTGASTNGTSGTSGTSGSNANIGQIFESGGVHQIVLFSEGTNHILKGDSNFTFDGSTLTIAPYQYSTGGNPVYRIIYHNDGTAGTAGIVVRATVPGQPYDGIIENRVPHNYQHQFVVGGNNIAHIDAQGFDVQQALIADSEVYFQGLQTDNSTNKFLVWNSGTSGNSLVGKVGWTTAGITGAQGPAGTPGSSGTSGQSGTSGTSGSSLSSIAWNSDREYIIRSNEQLTFSEDYILEDSYLLIEGGQTPSIGEWTEVIFTNGNGSTITRSGNNGYTITSPNNNTNASDGVQIKRFFDTATTLSVAYTWNGEDFENDWPFYDVGVQDPTEPNTINRLQDINATSESGTWIINVPANNWVAIGVWSNNSNTTVGTLQITLPYLANPDILQYSSNKYFMKEGKIFIGGNLLVKDSTIENNGKISVEGDIVLIGNSQITGTGIII